jgi:ectoine hydroxylase-related dioxygenase (phytanoyl-CoA dioxygenase family)
MFLVCVIFKTTCKWKNKSWDKKNELERSTVGYGQALIFSPHLIHGLALNLEENKTRVALEFRLFKK